MSDAFTTAVSGLTAATRRFETSAERVVAGREDVSLPTELVRQTLAELEFEANIKIIQAANRMAKRTLDIFA